MPLFRRQFLTSSAALIAASALPLSARRLWALSTFSAGDLRVDSLSDGHIEFPPEFAFANIPESERPDLLRSLGIDPQATVHSPLNITLLRQGDRTVLFDVGAGPDFVPTAGRLLEGLDALGVAAEDVTDVIFSHGHPDHLWGVLDEFDEPLFANAAMQMGRIEYDYWRDPQTAQSIGESRQSFAAGAARRLEVIGDAMTRFEDGDEVLPGVRAVMTPGHTPGHMSFQIGTPEQGLFVTGDFITMPASFLRPDLGSAVDHDPARAAETRRSTLDRLADEGWTILGYHLPDGGIGRVRRQGDAFTLETEPA
ncbi:MULTISPECIES: MBL fold metallo-hydrolase [unclassified Paracoccus (in: a-proteobacteria)]|uniref:MBL fold metallo-hydrolase n=1 Tax=unclassified Paracoccus (in: a-proteobacteria) TaxID=2688777 RepID=UPI0012B31F30|nr:MULTISPECIES: MBL fold metallo-hydrolase [unclassified Paracoccus (in: a-proteobacteria)]UXU76331.1 MBL fold metallo-hydrolase [Paracoccus sp. SMMA_5]UXU82331.1 MBL fold metallo-hydrolase [Paracoccus sp. SMMA_5_TC]